MSGAASISTSPSANATPIWGPITTCFSSAARSISRSSPLTQRLTRPRTPAGSASITDGKTALPFQAPSFDFALPDDGSLPLDGALPSLIDRRGKPRSMAVIADLGARLRSFSLTHPDPAALLKHLRDLDVDHLPEVTQGTELRYRARIATPTGLKELS